MIAAYPDRLSYVPGDEVSFRCSTDAPAFSVVVAREGSAPEVVWRLDDCEGQRQPVPADAAARGCGWTETFAISTSRQWRSGFYSVTMRAVPPGGNEEVGHAFFVLRPDGGTAHSPILLVLSTNTYNAYNDWGGPSLYTGGVRVSFDRPIAAGFLQKPEPAGRIACLEQAIDRDATHYRDWAQQHGLSDWSGAAGWHNWELPFVRWAETSGFALDVAVNSDLEFHPEVLAGHRLMVSVGHDEYWSWAMRDTAEQFISQGGNVAFFSGNDLCWQVRFEDDGRTMVSYKYQFADDPVFGTSDQHLLTSLWCDHLIGRPENRLTGVSASRGGYVRLGLGVPRGSGGYTVWRPENWVFEGTDLRYGDLLGAAASVVAYEADGCEFTVENGLPIPTHADGTPAGFTILATSPARLWSADELPSRYEGEPGDLENTAERLFGSLTPQTLARVSHGNAVMGTYTSGGTVFTTGCTDWAYGIAARDPQVVRITANVLERLSSQVE